MAKLLARVFQYDVTVCPTCAGRMKTIAALTAPSAIEAFLNAVDLPSRAPPIAPSRLDRQLEFDEAAWARLHSGGSRQISLCPRAWRLPQRDRFSTSADSSFKRHYRESGIPCASDFCRVGTCL